MTEPVMAQKAPYEAELQPGTYYWCACGRSAKQPFCDGSHKGTGLSPIAYEVLEPKKVWFCGCKQTGHAPLCDGTHKRL